MAASVVLFAASCTQHNTQADKRTISLDSLKHSPHNCEETIESQFLGEASLLVSNPICAVDGATSGYQIAVVDLQGKTLGSVNLDNNSKYPYVGPPGYIFIPGGGRGWLIFDNLLHPLGSVPIQQGESEGEIILSPSRRAAALIFTQGDGYSFPWRYYLIAGNPSAKIGELKTSVTFPGITDLGAADTSESAKQKVDFIQSLPSDKARAEVYASPLGELWFFDPANKQYLTKRYPTGSKTLLTDAAWLVPGDEEAWCSVKFSTNGPTRFLAHCVGTSAPFGRALPIGWGHNRIIVYDAGGKVLYQRQIGSGATPSLSPSGHLVAISGPRSIEISELP